MEKVRQTESDTTQESLRQATHRPPNLPKADKHT